ncbi:hypothetical protein BGX29_009809 [Mortierella sp. GBA35]|nr:hypothetical protein BGX29_009809 [Mortierella sp. GBA35]
MLRTTTASMWASSARILRQPLAASSSTATKYRAAAVSTRLFSISAAASSPPPPPQHYNSLAPTNSTPRHPRVLVTGSLGQLGSGLVKELRSMYGNENVVASDIRKAPEDFMASGPFVYADVMNYSMLERIVVDWRIDWVVHYSALLSAVAEKNPALALSVNMTGFQNMLELAKVHGLRIYSPSTIGAFGPSTPKNNTPDLTIMRPNTIYGITKLHNELLGEYYREKFGVDFRSARYPGILSADTPPGGGTTDYAAIADSWPASLDDSMARRDFGWKEEFGMERMVKLMLDKIQAQVDAEKKATTSATRGPAAMAA